MSAKLNSPCLSTDATGTIAKRFAVRRKAQQRYLAYRAQPHRAPSDRQRSLNLWWAYLTKVWIRLTPAQRDTWSNAPNPDNLPTRLIFIQTNIPRVAAQTGAMPTYPQGPPIIQNFVVFFASFLTDRVVRLQAADVDFGDQTWMIVVQRDQDNSFTNWSDLQILHLGHDFTIQDTVPASGTWFYKATWIDRDGRVYLAETASVSVP